METVLIDTEEQNKQLDEYGTAYLAVACVRRSPALGYAFNARPLKVQSGLPSL